VNISAIAYAYSFTHESTHSIGIIALLLELWTSLMFKSNRDVTSSGVL